MYTYIYMRIAMYTYIYIYMWYSTPFLALKRVATALFIPFFAVTLFFLETNDKRRRN